MRTTVTLYTLFLLASGSAAVTAAWAGDSNQGVIAVPTAEVSRYNQQGPLQSHPTWTPGLRSRDRIPGRYPPGEEPDETSPPASPNSAQAEREAGLQSGD